MTTHPRTHYPTACAVVASLATLASLAAAEPPIHDIPRPLANHMLSGQNVRLLILGDSITNPIFGALHPDGTPRNHCPPQNGIFNTWTPAHGWRGLIVSPPSGNDATVAYSNWHGIGAFARYYSDGRALSPRLAISDLPDGQIGFVVDAASQWLVQGAPNPTQPRLTSYLYTPRSTEGELVHHSHASTQIGRGDLRVRHVVYTGPGVASVPKLSFTRTGDSELVLNYPAPGPVPTWNFLEYPAASPASTWDRDTQRFETSSRFNFAHAWTPNLTHYITAGTLFYDNSSDGMQLATIAHGGWNNIDHLRTPSTYATPGYSSFLDRGFSDPGLLAWLDAFDMTAPQHIPVVVITLGTNVATPDNGGSPEAVNGLTAEAYAVNVQRIIQRYRKVYERRGHDPYFILLAMYDFAGIYPNPFVASRAEWLWHVKQNDPRPERIGFVNLPASMGYLGAGFDPAWYFSSIDHHLSKAGSIRVAQALWSAFLDARCPADYNADGSTNSEDFFKFLADFSSENIAADLTSTANPALPGYATPDGILNSEDFFYFVTLFTQPCQ